MANIRIDADGLQNNISSMRAYINELDSLNARTQTLMTQIASLDFINNSCFFKTTTSFNYIINH